MLVSDAVSILLVGAGKLGSRHLQALSQFGSGNVHLFVVDPSESSRSVASQRFGEMPANEKIQSVSYFVSLEEITRSTFDLAIVATTSEFRKDVIEQLALTCSIRFLVLEKFLFQDEQSYDDVAQILAKYDIKTWVNLPRRQWVSYKELKAQLDETQVLQVDVSGSKWSMATSAIHYIDLISFLIGVEDYDITKVDFGEAFVQSYSVVTGNRESKFIEFFGCLSGVFANSTSFHFRCLEIDLPLTITITTTAGPFVIFEELSQYYRPSSLISAEGVLIRETFYAPYQSELTQNVADEIITSGKCDLPTYDVAAKLHLTLLRAYIAYVKAINPKYSAHCPIT